MGKSRLMDAASNIPGVAPRRATSSGRTWRLESDGDEAGALADDAGASADDAGCEPTGGVESYVSGKTVGKPVATHVGGKLDRESGQEIGNESSKPGGPEVAGVAVPAEASGTRPPESIRFTVPRSAWLRRPSRKYGCSEPGAPAGENGRVRTSGEEEPSPS